MGALAGFAQRTAMMVKPDQQPLIIVDSFTTDFNHLLLEPGRIQSIDILKDSSAVILYGDKAKNGILIIKPKKNTEIIRFNDMLNLFHITGPDRNLNVCIDNVRVKDSNKLLADRSDIVTVEIIRDIYWITPLIAGPEERYINIVTRKAKKPFM